MATHPSPLRLGELDLPSSTDALFQLGELLARTNAAGRLLPPVRLSHVAMTLPIGRWEFRTPALITPGAFAPAHAAQQFGELPTEILPTILGGYARLARQQLDPTYPGFTDSLLAQLLPGAEVLMPRPRPIGFELDSVLQAYGTMLVYEAEKPHLRFAAPRPPATPPADEAVLLATLVLFASRRDLTAWLTRVAACEPARPLAQVLGALAQGRFYTASWGGLIPKLLAWVMPRKPPAVRLPDASPLVVVALQVLSEAYAAPESMAAIHTSGTAFRVLRAALDQLPPDSPDSASVRTTVVAGMLDGLYALATRADACGQAEASIASAQLALLALQVLPAPATPEQAEAWLARIQMQEYTYRWGHLSPDQPLEANVVRAFGGYAGSARLVASAWCTTAGAWYSEGRVTNQLWTAAWFGLERLRLALRLAYALGRQEPLPAGPARWQATLALKYLLDHYHQAQQEMAAMLARNLQPGRTLSMWVQTMLDEGPVSLKTTQVGYDLQALEPVENALRTHGYGPQVLEQLGRLVASLVPVVPAVRSAASAPLPAAAQLGYEAEEDLVYQQVLAPLLHRAYLTSAGQTQQEDGTPLIPPPANPLSGAALTAYQEAWLTQHPAAVSPPGVLNLSPTLRSMAECLAEYRFLLNQSKRPALTQVLQQLAGEPGVASLATRPFAPDPAPDVWRYTGHRRYAPFRQYPQPAGSQGSQLGLRLSRVGFNAARDTGFFFYDLDYHSYILGSVALVRRQAAGCCRKMPRKARRYLRGP